MFPLKEQWHGYDPTLAYGISLNSKVVKITIENIIQFLISEEK
jgi:hypothetical protein